MTDTINYADDNFERLYMVGVRLEPGAHEPDLYTLVLYNEVSRNDQNRPLTSGGRIVFFRDTADANRAIDLGDSAFRKYRPVEQNVAYVYDVPRVLALIIEAETERRSTKTSTGCSAISRKRG